MAVAAYASVLNLLRVVDNIQHPSRLRLFPDPTQIHALQDKLSFLQDFFEVHSSTITKDVEFMVRKIPRATYDAELLIHNYAVDQLAKESGALQNDVVGGNIDSFHNEMHRVIQELSPINEALKKTRATQQQPRIMPNKITGKKPHPLTSSLEKNKMVGFDDQLEQVLEKITGNQPNLVIVPIVGMGGIGKTTLARNVFDHPYNLHHFSVRIWLTISQDYSVKKVLQGLLIDGVLGDMKDRELGDESEVELITRLHQKLFGQRYLIVLDDVWSTEAWDDLRWGFPDNGKGSRVMVTTRLYDIASSLGSENNSYSMKFLDEDKSWDLFSEKAFEKGGRSPELEEIGREISERCNGLPLVLVVIGGLLANSNMSVEYWQTVAENVNSFAFSAYDEHCLKILSLSYHHLPIHLKSCFLYTRHYEEDSDIQVSKLIKTWVSQGFVKPMRGKSLEETARKYMEDLVGRNMLLIRERGRKGNIKVCAVHDLLRDLSIEESNKEQLMEIPRIISLRSKYDDVCFICEARKKDITILHTIYTGYEFRTEILVCNSCVSKYPEFARPNIATEVKFESQSEPLLTTFRGIALHWSYGDPHYSHKFRLLWNLEILQIRDSRIVLPKELWEMPQLRHVKVYGFTMGDPESTKNDAIVLENLQTLKTVEQFKFTEDIVRRIPNLRKIGLDYRTLKHKEEDWSFYYLQNLVHLQKLETLYIECLVVPMDLCAISFPWSLKELTLYYCRIAWDDLTIIGSLPNLQVLKLLDQSVLGEEWCPVGGEFLRLKFLKLEWLSLYHWNVGYETPFPALETLVLNNLWSLKAIPREIGELSALKSIYLKECPENIKDSARVIVEEQQIYGNEGLAAHVTDVHGQSYQIGGDNV